MSKDIVTHVAESNRNNRIEYASFDLLTAVKSLQGASQRIAMIPSLGHLSNMLWEIATHVRQLDGEIASHRQAAKVDDAPATE